MRLGTHLKRRPRYDHARGLGYWALVSSGDPVMIMPGVEATVHYHQTLTIHYVTYIAPCGGVGDSDAETYMLTANVIFLRKEEGRRTHAPSM